LVQLKGEFDCDRRLSGRPQAGVAMPKQGRIEERIIAALRQAESEIAVKAACR
jgi:hypothetical protein